MKVKAIEREQEASLTTVKAATYNNTMASGGSRGTHFSMGVWATDFPNVRSFGSTMPGLGGVALTHHRVMLMLA